MKIVNETDNDDMAVAGGQFLQETREASLDKKEKMKRRRNGAVATAEEGEGRKYLIRLLTFR